MPHPCTPPQAEGGGEDAPAASPLAPGTWRLVWTQQGETANPLQKRLANQVENFQIIDDDGQRLENLVRLAPGLRVRASAAAGPEAGPLGPASRTSVDIDEVVLEAGPLRLPLPIKTDGRGFVEWCAALGCAGLGGQRGAGGAPALQPLCCVQSSSKAAALCLAAHRPWLRRAGCTPPPCRLYLDEGLRVTRGNKGSVFIHVRER